jgi:uncharacterized protein YkwD
MIAIQLFFVNLQANQTVDWIKMKQHLYIISILLILSPLPSSCHKSNPIEPEDESSINKELVLQLINTHRASGCNCGSEGYYGPTTPVKWNDMLEMAAKTHSADMYSNNFFNHTGSDGSNMSDRIKRVGYNWTTCGENIGNGYKTEEQVVKGWINSPGHCRNIMNPNFKEIGMAMMGYYWTLTLGAR